MPILPLFSRDSDSRVFCQRLRVTSFPPVNPQEHRHG